MLVEFTEQALINDWGLSIPAGGETVKIQLSNCEEKEERGSSEHRQISTWSGTFSDWFSLQILDSEWTHLAVDVWKLRNYSEIIVLWMFGKSVY